MEKLWKFLDGDHPYRIMSDFAEQLQKDTDGLIIGYVDLKMDETTGIETLKLCMQAPDLKGYSQPLFQVKSKSNLSMYPVQLSALIFDSATIECDNIDELSKELMKMISMKQTMIALGNIKMIIERKHKMAEITSSTH